MTKTSNQPKNPNKGLCASKGTSQESSIQAPKYKHGTSNGPSGQGGAGFQLRWVWNSAKQPLELWESNWIFKEFSPDGIWNCTWLHQLPPIARQLKKVWSRCSVVGLKPLPNAWSSCSLLSWSWKNPARLFPRQNTLSIYCAVNGSHIY